MLLSVSNWKSGSPSFIHSFALRGSACAAVGKPPSGFSLRQTSSDGSIVKHKFRHFLVVVQLIHGLTHISCKTKDRLFFFSTSCRSTFTAMSGFLMSHDIAAKRNLACFVPLLFSLNAKDTRNRRLMLHSSSHQLLSCHLSNSYENCKLGLATSKKSKPIAAIFRHFLREEQKGADLGVGDLERGGSF